MSQLVEHARRELAILLPADSMPGDPGYEPGESLNGMNDHMRADILQMVMVFADQGHSGASAGYALSILEKLLRWENLTPLTDNPDEWVEVGPEVWQSKRRPEAFSTNGGKHYRLNSDEDRELIHLSDPWMPVKEERG